MPLDRHHDDFKEYPLRWVGYGSGFAESLRGPLSFTTIRCLHAVTTGFIFAHSLYKPYGMYQKHHSTRKVAISAADTFLYEILASGVIPPATAWAVRAVSGQLFSRANKTLKTWGSSIIAMSVLILISRPADLLVDNVMDATIRTIY